ncbi:MAG: hypothetical protein HY063_11215 [Bacteroidetes bacterium]|nr:hypothetical protein [Bacteroidota bacterium]
MKKYFAIVLFFISSLLLSQEKKVQYTKDFDFKNGIYLSFSDFKNNNPVLASKIISAYNKSDRDFFEKVLSKNSFSILDSSGKEQQYKTHDIWGFCQNGTVYINYGADYSRVTIIGSISHFVASVQRQIGGMYDPFYYNDPFYNPTRFVYVSEQFILDYETGKISEFNMQNMELLLSRDEELFKEFSALKKKQKRDSIFLYLRKYNEKHPIYFPE